MPKHEIKYTQVVARRNNDYEIKINRYLDGSWGIEQDGTSIYMTDDASLKNFLMACVALAKLTEGTA